MTGLVYHGPGKKSWDSVADPKPEAATDVVVRIDTTTICGTDLHILKGDVPAVESGRLLGHEAVGTVVARGSALSTLADRDRVIVPAITSCGRCSSCKRRTPSHCRGAGGLGWIFGHLIDGTQAEYTRVPLAETSVHPVPESVSDEQVLFRTDILPAGFEMGVRDGRVRPGDLVAVVGAGPVGIAAIITGKLSGASKIIAIDPAPSRREKARECGADEVIDAGEHVDARVRELSGGFGAEVAIEAVGTPETFETCTRIVRPSGTAANIGVHGAPATLHLEQLWIKNIPITMGLVDGTTVPTLLSLTRDGRIDPGKLATHNFELSDIENAYDTFGNADQHNALEVVIKR